MDALSWFALGIMVFVVLTLAYGFVAIHDIPYHIAKARNHPHQDAIHAGGWISLFTLHAIWPFLWIWAYAYHPKTGYAGQVFSESDDGDRAAEGTALEQLRSMKKRIAELEAKLETSPAAGKPNHKLD